MSYSGYSFKKIQEAMTDALLEYVKELNEDRSKLLSLDEIIYRNTILEKMRENDEIVGEIFEKDQWAEKVEQGDTTIVLIEEYLERMFKGIMNQFNAEHMEKFLGMFQEWEEHSEEFKMASLYVEELVTEEEWAAGVEEFKTLLDDYAIENGMSRLRAKLKMPPFDNVFDKVDWLKHELDDTTIDDVLAEVEE